MKTKLIKVIKREELVDYLKYKREHSTFSQGIDYISGYLDALENLERDILEGRLSSYLFEGSEEKEIIV